MTKLSPAEVLHDLKSAIRSHGYAWPGGYPMFAITDDGDTLSIDACKAEFRQVVRSTLTHARDGWEIVGVDINWEDMDMVCCHTGEPIECAYPADEADEQA